jgi:hypothetical protein
MYCPTCLRSIFKKTFIEGFAAMLSYDPVTRKVSIELVQEDIEFKEWTCAYCGYEFHQNSTLKVLDDIVEKWEKESDLCCVIY